MRSLRKPITIAILLFCCLAGAQAQKAVKKYIDKYEDLAVEKMKAYSIPASIILGVSIVESGAGTSDLARVFNNFFGVKGKNTDSRKKLGYQSAYREYATDTASYDHFCRILANKRFYQKLKGQTDYREWLRKMNEANYAEAKEVWVNKISATISKYKLYKFDEEMGLAGVAAQNKVEEK